MIKILNIQPFDHFGSIQRRSLQVALELRKENIKFVFVSPKEGLSFTKIALENGFKVYKTSLLRPVFIKDRSSLIHVLNWILGIPKNIVEIYKMLHIEQPDIIQVNGFVCFQEALVSAFCYRRRFLWVLIGTIYPRFLILTFLPLIRLASLRVFVAKKLVRFYFGKPDDTVIYEFVNTDKFNPERIKMSKLKFLRKTLSIDTNSPIVGVVGLISPVKGLEYLVRGIKLVKENYSDIKLIIAGGVSPHQPDYYVNLKNLICELNLNKNVIFLGLLEHERIPFILQLLDILVSASTHEGTPVSILEAMAMEIPVVATDIGGISEQIINYETGILIPPKNPEAIAEAVIQLLQNKDKRRDMGIRARKRAYKIFSAETCVLEYKKLYDNIANINEPL